MAANPKRATGANVKLRLRFEGSYGARAVGNYAAMAAYTWGVSERQPLEDDPLLGQGRDPLAPDRGAIDVIGSAEVPIDQRLIGYWLKLLMDDPLASTQVGARGFIVFPANPANNETITLNGTAWTFVTGAPVGDQTQIGADLTATLAQLVIDLNASADVNLTPATYTTYGDRLVVDHDTADASGNAYTLVSGIAGIRLSGATLAGGGLYRHDFNSGAVALPSATVEVEHGDLEAGSARFFVQQGIQVNSLSIGRQRSGRSSATLEIVAQSEVEEIASVAGVPLVLPIARLSQFQGYILVDGVRAANLSAGTFTIGNNLDIIGGLRDDGLIEGADPGQTSIALSLTGRFSNTTIKAKAEAKAAAEVRFGYRDPVSGSELLFHLHEIHLPKPAREINGPGGVEVTYEAVGAQDVALARSMRVSVWNDRPDYNNPA